MRRVKSWVFSGGLAGLGAKRLATRGTDRGRQRHFVLGGPGGGSERGNCAGIALLANGKKYTIEPVRVVPFWEAGVERVPILMRGLSWSPRTKAEIPLTNEALSLPQAGINVITMSARIGLTLAFAGTTWSEIP
jgi:hypothetical protein